MFIKNKEIVNKSAMLKLKLSFPNFSGLALHQWNYQFIETIARLMFITPINTAVNFLLMNTSIRQTP